MPSNIVVPQLGESVVEARVARWLKKVGEEIGAGEPIVELETDKIDLEVPSDQAGVLARIEHQEGDDVKVGEVLGVVDAAAKDASVAPKTDASVTPKTGTSVAPKTDASVTPKTDTSVAPKTDTSVAPKTDTSVAPNFSSAAPAAARPEPAPPAVAQRPEPDARATATARRMAEEHRIDLAQITGSGEGGRITKEDVQRAVGGGTLDAGRGMRDAGSGVRDAGAGAPAEPAPVARREPGERTEERKRMSKRRATIAKRLVEAQRTAAMLTTFNEVDMSAVMALRARRKESFQKQYGVNLGLSSFFVKASVAALRAFPPINAEIDGEEIVFKQYYDIGIAVGAAGGLVVPVLRDADRMSFAEIEHGVRDFAKRAEDGTLTLEDLKGGTFTITNGGVYGSLMSTPILNPPQVGILGLHKIEDRPVASGGQVVVKPMMYVALSYDHRIVDGREAVQFLVKIKELIEDPGVMLIEL